jgi:hypothetical protein
MARVFALLSLLAALLVAAQAAAAAEPTSGSPVVFTRATAGLAFVSWAAAGARADAVLVMYDSDNKPVARYYLENAWPSKIDVGSLDASKNEVSIESVEISHEGIRLDVVTDNKGCRCGVRHERDHGHRELRRPPDARRALPAAPAPALAGRLHALAASETRG